MTVAACTDESTYIYIAELSFKAIAPTAPMTGFAAGATPGDELNFEWGHGGHWCSSLSFGCVGLGP